MKRPIYMVDFEGKMTSISTDTPRTSVASDVQFGPVLAGTTLFGIVMWLYWPWFLAQFRSAIEQQADWGHVLVVPFISGYFVYLNREKLLAKPFRTGWSGLIVSLVGMAIYFICLLGPTTLRHANLMGFGVWLTICGLVLLFCGWRAMQWLWFPLVFWLVFGQYISERFMNIVTFKMQDVTAKGAHFLLALGLDVDLSGNTITIYSGGVPKPLNIAEACSGMRMLMAFLALGVTMAYTGFKPLGKPRSFDDWYGTLGGPDWRTTRSGLGVARLIVCSVLAEACHVTYGCLRNWRRIALVLMAFPTAIIVNVLRVCTLGLLSLVNTNFTAGQFHSMVGLVWLVPAFMIYLGLMWIIRQMVIEEPAAAPAVRRAAVSPQRSA